MNAEMQGVHGIPKALRVAFKDASDKIGGLAKNVAGALTGDRALREEGQAQLDQAHVEPEVAAVEAEDRAARKQQDRGLRRLRRL